MSEIATVNMPSVKFMDRYPDFDAWQREFEAEREAERQRVAARAASEAEADADGAAESVEEM